ncbi:voltage-dependent anion-selective channel-like [Drosophila ficusphila]|uniref:voltage-dependent anion-selective channel-like n=1 Tax=Drosophila ficusphila TaxID=30025 RepID=UPI001C8941A1|nr:voltage-dependent anion-selective channel-like [Drosophila ficusphila]
MCTGPVRDFIRNLCKCNKRKRERNERGERNEKGEKSERGERDERSERGERAGRYERDERGDRAGRDERGERNERAQRNKRGDRDKKADKGERGDKTTEENAEKDLEFLPPSPVEGEMASYFHVGFLAKMCLIHGYDHGVWKLQTTSKTENDFYLTSFGEGYPTWNSIYGGLEAYQEKGNYHASLAWLTDRSLLSDLGARGEALGGIWSSILKTNLTTSDGCECQCKLKCGFERNPGKVELFVPIYREPLLMGYILIEPATNYLLGYRTVFNVEDRKFEMHAFCAGFSNNSTEVGIKLENFEHLRGSIFQRIGEKWALALKTNLYGNVNARHLSFGGQYEWKPGTLLKAKLRGNSRIAFSFQRRIRKDIAVLFHVGFDGNNPINGKHSIGTSWYFNE